MDKTKERTRLEEILAEWDLNNQANRVLCEPAPDSGYEPVTCSISDTINLSSLGANANVSLTSPYTYTSSVGLGAFPNTIYTTGTSTSAPWATFNPNKTSAKINLNGEGADIEVNGWSLVDAVKRIEERLGLFQPNPDLEKEWADLKDLTDQYKKLEQHIRDKQATFDRIKAMPAPDVD